MLITILIDSERSRSRSRSRRDSIELTIQFQCQHNCPILEATIKETLRMYPPIHIGRLALADFDITTNTGKKIKVSKIYSN